MSWTRAMAKEMYESDDWVELKRLKTNRWTRMYIGGPFDSANVVSRVALDRGEVLVDRNGDRVVVIGPTGVGTDKWTHKTYSVKVEITK